MKRICLLVMLMITFLTLSAREVIHTYWGNYVEIVRVVLVVRSEVHYNTLMDTDNKVIHVHLNDTRLNAQILPIDFSSTPLISHISFDTVGRDLRISLHTEVVFYAESFFLQEENFKIVLDVYRKREPATLAEALEYLNFYISVGFLDRAARLQFRIDNGEFNNPLPRTTVDIPIPATPQPPIPFFENIDFSGFQHSNVLLYMKPDVTRLSRNLQNWINEAFRVYDIFINMNTSLDLVERTLNLYDVTNISDITFVEAMSMSNNILSDANIRINEIRLQLSNSWNRKPSSNVVAAKYTEEMIQHVLSTLNAYHDRVSNLQTEYERRIK